MAGFRDHEEFDAWQLANELRTRMRPVLRRPELRNDVALWKQLRKTVRGPCPNIAEGFSRFWPRDFANYVRVAKASLTEYIDHMKEAQACGYTTPSETAELIVLARRARGAASGLIRYLDSAKPPTATPPPHRRRQSRPRRSRRPSERDPST